MQNQHNLFYTEELHFANGYTFPDEREAQDLSAVLESSNPVGIAMGIYDESLRICGITRHFAENLGRKTRDILDGNLGLRDMICQTEKYPFTTELFQKRDGHFRVYMLQGDGTPILVSCLKRDSVDKQGKPIWILSIRVSQREQCFSLLEDIRQISQWYLDYDSLGNLIASHYEDSILPLLGMQKGAPLPSSEEMRRRVHPDDRMELRRGLREFFFDPKQGRFYAEYRVRIDSGAYRWVQMACQAIRRADGSVSRIAGLYMNIDQWKRYALQEKRQRAFHDAFTSNNLCEYFLDLRKNTYESLKISGSLLEVFEKTGSWDELVNRFTEEVVLPEYREAVRYSCDRNRIQQGLTKYKGEQCTEFRGYINGQERWLRNVVMHGDTDESGEPSHAILFLRDITDVKQEAQERSSMSKKNAAMQRLIQGMVYQIDRFSIIDLQNDRYEFYTSAEKLSIPPTGRYCDLLNALAESYRSLDRLETVQELLTPEKIRRDIQTPTTVYKAEVISLDGESIHQISFIPLEWERDTLTQVLMVSADVTRAKRADADARNALQLAYDAANQANQAKTRFLTNMSHDLRTPMNAIMGMTALAQSNLNDPEKLGECLKTIDKSSRLLMGMVNELLDMGRIESGNFLLEQEPFCWQELVDSVMAMYSQQAKCHGHSLKCRFANVDHSHVIGDKTRIQEVLSNFLTNAIKYTPDGGSIQVTLAETHCPVLGIGNFSMTVEDNGLGMSEEFQRKAFEPFTREDSKRISAIPGTGLGLSIVKNLLNLMNGDVILESAPGKGTRITASLSLELSKESTCSSGEVFPGQKEQTDNGIRTLEKLDCRGKTILVVEDNELNREILVRLLEPTGAEVFTATNGVEAFSLVRENPGKFQLVFMDIQMPQMDGYETAAAIRMLDRPDTDDLPIIAVTANAFAEDAALAVKSGMDGHLSKPLDVKKLAKVLCEYLQ